MNLELLKNPFGASDIEWRVQRSGLNGDKPWAMVLAYVTNRAIMDRLDEVCGQENWQNGFEPGPNGGVMCNIAILVDDRWITKYDGAENTEFEAIKGGLSGSMKRAAVQWGIGRYLYGLEATWAVFSPSGKRRDKIEGKVFKWDPPPLPEWALPEGIVEWINQQQMDMIMGLAENLWGQDDVHMKLTEALAKKFDVKKLNKLTQEQGRIVISGLQDSVADSNNTYPSG